MRKDIEQSVGRYTQEEIREFGLPTNISRVPSFDFDLGPNNRLISRGESRHKSEPVRGTGKVRRVINRNNRRR